MHIRKSSQKSVGQVRLCQAAGLFAKSGGRDTLSSCRPTRNLAMEKRHELLFCDFFSLLRWHFCPSIYLVYQRGNIEYWDYWLLFVCDTVVDCMQEFLVLWVNVNKTAVIQTNHPFVCNCLKTDAGRCLLAGPFPDACMRVCGIGKYCRVLYLAVLYVVLPVAQR